MRLLADCSNWNGCKRDALDIQIDDDWICPNIRIVFFSGGGVTLLSVKKFWVFWVEVEGLIVAWMVGFRFQKWPSKMEDWLAYYPQC